MWNYGAPTEPIDFTTRSRMGKCRLTALRPQIDSAPMSAVGGNADLVQVSNVIKIDRSRRRVMQRDDEKLETLTAPSPRPLLVETIRCTDTDPAAHLVARNELSHSGYAGQHLRSRGRGHDQRTQLAGPNVLN